MDGEQNVSDMDAEATAEKIKERNIRTNKKENRVKTQYKSNI